jgi:hypothetical protein
MPFRRIPNTTPAVLRALQKARDQYLATPVVAERAISAAQFAALDTSNATSLLSRFTKEVSEADQAQALQAPLTSVTAQKAAQLQMYVSHFHQALDNGIARGFFQAGARSYYGRDVSNPVLPPMSSYQELAEAAAKVDSGETARATAEAGGYQLMANPARDEVNDVALEFNGAWAASKAALAKTDTEKEDVQALYPEAQALAEDLADTIEFFHRKDKVASSRRVKCARWGVVYVFGADETPDPAPNPPTPPPGP